MNLSYILSDLNLDIIGVAETWTHEGIADSEIKLNGFSMYRKDRQSHTRGGGIILYVKEYLTSSLCFENICKDCEAVFCKILPTKNKGQDIYVGLCYKSPSAPLVEISSLFAVIREASLHNAVIMGDFNFPGINWDNFDCDTNGFEFVQLVQDSFLHQHVHTATRGIIYLDLVFSTEEGMVEDLRVQEPLVNSDHSIIIWKTCFKSDIKACTRVARDFHKADYTEINHKLSNTDWDVLFQDLTTEEMWEKFSSLLEEIIESNVPTKLFKQKSFRSG